MDTKIYKINEDKEIKIDRLTKEQMQSIINNKASELLGLNIISSEYKINEENNEYIDTLAIDENYVLTVVEYKIGYGTRVISNGLMFIDYIKNNLSEFKMLMNEVLKEEAINVNYNPRLIVIGDSFNKYDYECISRLPYNIELVTLNTYENKDIIIQKQYVSRNKDFSLLKCNLSTNTKSLLNYINDVVLTIDDSITINAFNNIITYRKLKTFLYVIVNDGIQMILDNKLYDIESMNDVDNISKIIEDAYDQR